MAKKLLAALLCAVMTISVFSGCASNANANASSSAASSAAEGSESGTGEAAASDGTITVASSTLGSTLDPVDCTDGASSMFIYAAYDRLVKYATKEVDGVTDADVENFDPSIAKDWTVSEDQKTWTFYLDENAKFANGDPVTSEDVKFSFERCGSRPQGEFVFSLTNIESIDTPDDYTVVFNLHTHCPIFLQLIEVYSFAICNKEEVEAQPEGWLNDHTAGSGPYVIEKYDVATEVSMTARDDYWNGRAANDRMVVKLVKEISNRQVLLEKGDVDIAFDLPEKELDALDAEEGIRIQTDPSNKILYLAMNCQMEPFDDPLVRQAICYAIPYDSLIEDVMFNRATRLKSCIPSIMPGHIENENTYYEQDLDKAKELLAQAGYPDGFTFDFTLGTGFQDWEDAAVLIQAELAKIGVTMNIEKMERAQFLEVAGQGKLAAFINRFMSFVNDPGYLTGLLLHTDGDFNYNLFDNAQVNELYQNTVDTIDTEERLEIFSDVQEVVKEEAPWAYLYEYNFSLGLRDNIQDYVYHPDMTLRFDTLKKA